MCNSCMACFKFYCTFYCIFYCSSDRSFTSFTNRLTHVGMDEEDFLADERLWMYMTTIDEAEDRAHKNVTEIKYISEQPINYHYMFIDSNNILGYEREKILTRSLGNCSVNKNYSCC